MTARAMLLSDEEARTQAREVFGSYDGPAAVHARSGFLQGARHARHLYEAERNRLLDEIERQSECLKEFERAIGEHSAPEDCFATGPMTGDSFRDLIQCPACSALAMYRALKIPLPEKHEEKGRE